VYQLAYPEAESSEVDMAASATAKTIGPMLAHEDFPGLYERNGYWYARYKVKGVGVKKSFGPNKTGMKKAIAHLATIQKIRDDREGYIPRTAKEKPQTANDLRATPVIIGSVTVGELCDDLLRHIQRNPKEYKDQRNPVYRIGLIKQEFGDRIATSIRPPELADWLDSVKNDKTGKPLAPASRNRLKVTLSSMYRYGKERDKIQVNPARDVKQKKIGHGVIRFLRDEEEQKIRKVLQNAVDACPTLNKQMRKRLEHRIHELTISLGTGMRKGEQYGLQRPDVDLEHRRISVRETKNGEVRHIPMNDDVYGAFKALLAMHLSRKNRAGDMPNQSPSDSIFGIGDNKKWWIETLKKAKVKNYRWHDNRHTFCSRLAQAGVPLKTIQELAGHKTIQMTARYAHMDQRHLESAVSFLNRNRAAY
jgi:integrase